MNTSNLGQPSAEFDFTIGGVNNSTLPALAMAFGGGLLYLSLRGKKNSQSKDVFVDEQRKPVRRVKEPLRPLVNFNYATAPPIQLRPYAPKFHLTMGHQAIDQNDLIVIDSSYRRRLAYRRHLLVSNPSETYGHLSSASGAVSEFYTYIFNEHLPGRFPRQFSKSPSGTLVQNLTTTNTYPIIPQSAPNALRALGQNLDEDFVFLQPSDGTWRVAAFVVCFPNGFTLHDKLGWKLSDVHAPVPGLAEKLGKSLERYFTNMPAGVENCIQRLNWGIATTGELFTPTGTHVYEGVEVAEDQKIDVNKCVLRCEKQTLWKLPESGAIVFGIKTYTYPLSDVKAEAGEAERLAKAIEGLGDAMGHYKARGVWGKQVLEYLRS